MTEQARSGGREPGDARAPFTHDVRVRIAEIDHAGVVFNAHYLGWCDDARLAYVEHLGFPAEWFAARDELSMLRHAEIDWLASLRAFEHARIDVVTERVGTSSFTLLHRIRRAGTETVVCEIRITYAHVDLRVGRKAPLPEEFAAALRAHAAPGGG